MVNLKPEHPKEGEIGTSVGLRVCFSYKYVYMYFYEETDFVIREQM